MCAYIQIKGYNDTVFGIKPMAQIYEEIVDDKFKVAEINSKEDIWPQFKKIFGAKL